MPIYQTQSVQIYNYPDISDHFPVFLQTHLLLKPAVKPCFIYKRNFTEDAKLRFVQSLHEANWVETLGANNDYDKFLDIFKELFNNSFPLVKYNT